MSYNNTLQQNDVGVTLQVTILQDDNITPQNISAGTQLTIYLIRPDYSVITGVANFVTDGSDGQLQYVTQANDLALVGIYRIQASYVIGPSMLYSKKDLFLVELNL